MISFRNLRRRTSRRHPECAKLQPPVTVRGLKELNRDAFCKKVPVPRLIISQEKMSRVLPVVKYFLLRMENVRPVQPRDDGKREILLPPMSTRPGIVWNWLPSKALQKLKVTISDLYIADYELTYENWTYDAIFRSVFPENEESLTSFSRIGHIVHVNLKDHLLPYKKLIGQVLFDKVPGCKTVINKQSTIENPYRFMDFELICGEEQYVVDTRENGIPYKFDFSKVYWNPRLSTEHARITKMLHSYDAFYDVFAGVGPFAVPAARLGCNVMANDLNPDSYYWLEYNMAKNNCKDVELFNKDGREFILTDMKKDLYHRLVQHTETIGLAYNMHITMNLPAIAIEFLSAFRGLFKDEYLAGKINFDLGDFVFPIVHVYLFSKGNQTRKLALELVEDAIGCKLENNVINIHYVRNVSTNKDMYCVSFKLTKEILTVPMDENEDDKTKVAPKIDKKIVTDTNGNANRKSIYDFGNTTATATTSTNPTVASSSMAASSSTVSSSSSIAMSSITATSESTSTTTPTLVEKSCSAEMTSPITQTNVAATTSAAAAAATAATVPTITPPQSPNEIKTNETQLAEKTKTSGDDADADVDNPSTTTATESRKRKTATEEDNENDGQKPSKVNLVSQPTLN